MFRLIYVSSASWVMKDEDLTAILAVSRRKNRALAVTGMLLHLEHSFLQVLEGPEAPVRSIFTSIQRDARHHDVRVLVEHEVEERFFADWTMGFDRPTPERSADVFAITREAIYDSVPVERVAEIAILLRNFYRINRCE